jgi:hypothetical protein
MEPKPVPPITAEQLQLLAPWYSQNGRDSRTLALFDAIPKYPFPTTRVVEKIDPIQTAFTVGGSRYAAEIWPARVKLSSGEARLAFPGAREELVERALRFLAVQQHAQTRITPDQKGGSNGITVWFSLSMIRRHLLELNHGYSTTEIREALDILSDTRIGLRPLDGKKFEIVERASIFTRYVEAFRQGDESGEECYGAVTFHPLATQAILELAFYPINQLRVGKLKVPLARWLTTRMSHNYRQAGRDKLMAGEGYHIALATILTERGLAPRARLRDHLPDVRRALEEVRKAGILRDPNRPEIGIPPGGPYDERLEYARTKGRRAVIGAVWTLYPSVAFIKEITQGNKEMLEAKRNADHLERRESSKSAG